MVEFDTKTATACPKCGLQASSLLHRFCQHDGCPVLAALSLQRIDPLLERVVNPTKPIKRKCLMMSDLQSGAAEVEYVLAADHDTEIDRAYAAGWRMAAIWAHRDDLLADIGSPAYERDKTEALGLQTRGEP